MNGTHVTDPDFYAPTGSGTDGQHLRSNGANKDPTWEYPIVTQLNGDNTSHNREIYAPSAVGEEYQVLESTGEGEPKWRDPMVSKINGYGPLYGRANDIYVFLSKGNDGQIAYGGGSRPTWGNPIIAAVNGGSGHLSKQIWAPESAGESGQILQSRGSEDPRWVDPTNLYLHMISATSVSSLWCYALSICIILDSSEKMSNSSLIVDYLKKNGFTVDNPYPWAFGAYHTASVNDTVVGVYTDGTDLYSKAVSLTSMEMVNLGTSMLDMTENILEL